MKHFLLLGIAAIAAFPAYSAVNSGSDNRPIDELRNKALITQRSSKAAKIGRAWDDLLQGRFAKARLLARSLQSDPIFGDYGHSLAGLADRMEADSKNKAKKFPEALKLSRSAVDHLARVELTQPYSPLIRKIPDELAAADLAAGQALHGTKKWRAAENEYEKAFQFFATQGDLNLIRTEHLERYAQACSKKNGPLCEIWIQRIVQSFPKSSLEVKALARYMPDEAERLRPAERITRSSQSYKAPDLDQAAFDAAFASLLQGRRSDAIKAFEQILIDYPKSSLRFRTRYWLSKAYELDGNPERAKSNQESLLKDSPLTYYGWLASLSRGVSLREVIPTDLPIARLTDPLLTPMETIRIRRAEMFLAEKRPLLAAEELREIRARDPLASPFLFYLATLQSESGNFNNAFSILGDLIQRGYDGVSTAYGLKLIFPTPQLALIRKYAKDSKLDPVLVMSLIKQESAFDSRANSPVGAAGLMQLMHATALETDPAIQRADLIEADANLRVGCRYLRQLMSRYRGNIILSLAAYNAGPAAVDRWVRDFGKNHGMLEFIEQIPYKETRDYVSSIMRNYHWYEATVGTEGPRSLEYFWTAVPTVSAVSASVPAPRFSESVPAPAFSSAIGNSN